MAISLETAYLWIIWLNRESVCKTLSHVTTVPFVLSSFFAIRMDLRSVIVIAHLLRSRYTRRYIFAALPHTHAKLARGRERPP